VKGRSSARLLDGDGVAVERRRDRLPGTESCHGVFPVREDLQTDQAAGGESGGLRSDPAGARRYVWLGESADAGSRRIGGSAWPAPLYPLSKAYAFSEC
jgi:hypothetical protein